MASLFYEILGLIGSFLISTSVFLQVYKVIQTKSARDISLTWESLYLVGIILILIYGIAEQLWPIYIPGLLELLAILILMILKFKYDKLPELQILQDNIQVDQHDIVHETSMVFRLDESLDK